MKTFRRSVWLALLIALAGASFGQENSRKTASALGIELWRQVEVIRTAHGVPHIRAKNLRAAGYALAWLQCEDYGAATPMDLLEASGKWASIAGYEKIESDFIARRYRESILQNYSRISTETRSVYEGFAAGVNRYIELHPDEFPARMPSDFSGQDVAALEIAPPPVRKIRAFIARLSPPAAPERQNPIGNDEGEETSPDDGSNAWAFAPSRTKSGKAILLRNPHLVWTAGYYEAHMTVPGVIDFYGDFRIGGPFAVIGGFNRSLGWSTTNNSPDLDQFYALDVDPNKPDHYLFDGGSMPLKRELLTVPFRNGEGLSTETREFWSTPMGPVIHRANGKIYIVKTAGDGEYRAGEQFLRMMRATSLAEWKEAMKMRARVTSNFTYADRAGNIFYVWNASLPLLPHPPSEDLAAVPARGKADIWTRYVPFESLPQLLNPPGGYLHNENNSPHYTNVRGPVNTKNAFPNFETPELSLRSQLAIQLVGGDEKFSLEDIVRLKHSYRMLLADRVKDDLLAAIRATSPSGDMASAMELLERWDNTAAPDSHGSTLFEIWWAHYSGIRPPERVILPDAKRFAKVWSESDPFNTPRGLADPDRAVESFAWAVEETKRRYGSFDVAWGDVHRVRRGKVDVPVGGCSNDLGCFRILGFTRDADGKLTATGGDGWVLAVEFGDTPRAYSVLAYGESRRTDSPWHADQAEMFAKRELKKVAFTEADINAQSVLRYKPGEKRVS
jgi:acyl-homoserine-lactone acylase